MKKFFTAQGRTARPGTPGNDDSNERHGQGASPSRDRLVINGRFLVQEITGVQRVACEATRAIDQLLGEGALQADVTLLVPPGRWVQPLKLRHIRVRVVGAVAGVWWEQFVLPRHLHGAPLLCLGNTAPAACLLGRPRGVSVMIHDVSFIDHPGAYRLAYRMGHRLMLALLLRRAGRIFTVSHTERRRLIALHPAVAPRITVTRNGGWSDEGVPPPGNMPLLPPGYALYVGSLSHRKNFGRLLQAAVRIVRETDIDFVFAGSAGRVLRRPDMTIPDDTRGRIHFVGQVNDRARLSALYAAAGVLVFPSLYEASPLPPVEAAWFGCPVVASNIPSIWERCGRAVAYCNPLSVDSIVMAVRGVLEDGDWRAGLVAQGLRLAARDSWIEQARALCRRILPSASTGRSAAEVEEPSALSRRELATMSSASGSAPLAAAGGNVFAITPDAHGGTRAVHS